MVKRLIPKIALAAAAAAVLYVPALGLPLSDSCMHSVAVAGAAPTPSPSCGGDLRECLRASADMHPTTFGVRYVTADDVATCMEAFKACSHGGASRGGSPVPPESREPQGGNASTSSRDMPPFRPFTLADSLAFDCTVSGDAVTCDITRRDQLPEAMDSWTAQFTGKLSGSTMTGTQITRTQSHYTAVVCIENSEGIEKVSYTFNPDRTATISSGGIQWHTSNCSSSNDQTTPARDATAPWSLSG